MTTENSDGETKAVEAPLVTFALFAYAQEKFIRAAIEAAFAQTYEPLEIILSDDCSEDCTFRIMEELTAAYRGPHTVVLNRNCENLGIGNHINRVMDLARGDLIVAAAGDDISLPTRTATLVSVWASNGCPRASIYSSCEVIDENGAPVRTESFEAEHQRGDSLMRIDGKQRVFGPSHAWSKKLFDEFGEIKFDAVNEDAIIQFRASLMDGVFIVPDILVKYRLHQTNVTNIGASYTGFSPIGMRVRVALVHYKRTLSCLRNFEQDISHIQQVSGMGMANEVQEVKRKISEWELKVEYAESNILKRVYCILKVAKGRFGFREFARMVSLLFTPRLS